MSAHVAEVRPTARYGSDFSYPTADVDYQLISKNACTTVQATLLAVEGVAVDADDSMSVYPKAEPFRSVGDQCSRSLTVVRDPARRLVSAYLDKIVAGPRRQVYRFITEHPVAGVTVPHLVGPEGEADIERMTFLDVARTVALIDDMRLDGHFRSQWWVLEGRHTHHVVSMEQPGWQARIEQVVGRPLVTVRPHATAPLQAAKGTAPGADLLTVAELRARLVGGLGLPHPDDLLSGEVRELVAMRYARDAELVAAVGA